MLRGFIGVLLSAVVICGYGCAMCCSPDLYTYPTYGGRVQRSDPEYGRVGSIFSDPYVEGQMPGADGLPPPLNAVPTQPTLNQPEALETVEPKPHVAPAKGKPRRTPSQQGWR